MGLTTQELAARKAGQTAETNGFGAQERPLRPAGVYELKNKAGEVVDTQIVKSHPKFGDSQAAAFERVGYEFVRAAKPGEIKEIEVDAAYLATENKSGGQDANETMKGLAARLSLLEKENADLKAGKAAEESKGASDDSVKAAAKEEAKVEAAARVDARAEGEGSTPRTDEDGLRASRGADETQRAEKLKEDAGKTEESTTSSETTTTTEDSKSANKGGGSEAKTSTSNTKKDAK